MEKPNELEERRARTIETARRAAVFTRRQLEMLAYEGSISEKTFDELVAAHPQSVSQQEIGFAIPEFPSSVEPIRLTYFQAIKSVVVSISENLHVWQRTLSEIDPMNLGLFAKDSEDTLASDLTAAILMMRNQSLYHLFDEATSTEIHARSVAVLLETDKFAIATYDILLRVWLNAIANLDLPHLAIAAWVLHESGERTKNAELFRKNPFFEVILAEKLVITSFCEWNKVAESTTLCPE